MVSVSAAQASGQSATPTPPSHPIPFLNRWDIRPITGQLIGPLRMVTGLFMFAMDCLCTLLQGQPPYSWNGLPQVKRGCQAFASFIPSVRRKMIEDDQRMFVSTENETKDTGANLSAIVREEVKLQLAAIAAEAVALAPQPASAAIELSSIEEDDMTRPFVSATIVPSAKQPAHIPVAAAVIPAPVTVPAAPKPTPVAVTPVPVTPAAPAPVFKQQEPPKPTMAPVPENRTGAGGIGVAHGVKDSTKLTYGKPVTDQNINFDF